jgi:23S rRNA pseudouridine2605 synthase
MMNPVSALPRVYRVRVKGWLKERDIAALKRGVTIAGTRYRSAEFDEETDSKTRSNVWYRVTLFEGKNREIRKIFEHFGCMVNRLIRIQYGPFELGSLRPGELREVPEVQVKRLQTALFKLVQQPRDLRRSG